LNSKEEVKAMSNRTIKALLVVVLLTLSGVTLRPVLSLRSVWVQGSAKQTLKDSEELKRLHDEDQSDRTPPDGKDIDWGIVSPRDKARLARVKELYAQNRLQTGYDYYHAAMILQRRSQSTRSRIKQEVRDGTQPATRRQKQRRAADA
jgi:hypothetical protein